MNELYNPYDDEDDLMLVENKPKRRKRKNPEPVITVATPLLLLIAGYLGWVAYNQTKYKVWNWQPWQLARLAKPRLRLRQNNAQAEEERRRAEFHRAVEESMKPTVFTVDTDIPWRKPTIKPRDEETVSFIYP
ncbi:hypothetical protein ES707_07386 [subsurface metagenome]